MHQPPSHQTPVAAAAAAVVASKSDYYSAHAQDYSANPKTVNPDSHKRRYDLVGDVIVDVNVVG